MNSYTKSFWLDQKWGALVLDRTQEFPNGWSDKSHKKFTFICDCGHRRTTSMKNVTDAKNASCGTCNHLPASHWLAQTWGKLTLDPNQELPEEWSSGSNTLMWFLCSCGRRFQLKPNSVRKDYTSCGHCDDKSQAYWLTQQWDQLKLDPNQELPSTWGPMSQSKFNFICSCGKVVPIRMCSVMLKSNTTCGKCNVFPKEYWLSQKWGRLKLDSTQFLPDAWSRYSVQKFRFICDCGRLPELVMNNVCLSCGACDYKSKSYWLSQTWGNLRLDPNQDLPDEWGSGSGVELTCLCTCGNRCSTTTNRLEHGGKKSCGCLIGKAATPVSAEVWFTEKWGKLKLSEQQPLTIKEWGASSNHRFQFDCDCGNTVHTPMNNVTNGHTSSCGKCTWRGRAYWLGKQWGLLKLDPNQELPDEWGPDSNLQFYLLCNCGNRTLTYFYNIRRTQSCGCTKPGTTEFSPAAEIYKFIRSLSPFLDTDALFSHRFKTEEGRCREYDVYIPSKKLAIEYHGLIWHSEKYMEGSRDWNKYNESKLRGDRIIQIYSDEWENRQEVMKEMLRSLIQPSTGKRIKPTFELHTKTPPEARTFLDQHHYLGSAKGKVGGCLTVVAKYGEAIVGVWVFMKRETNVILWHRACWHHAYKAWNPHERALALALPELRSMGFTRMVTFSDNRFHTGGLYEKLGFTFEKELKPDFRYVKGSRRLSKQALRVKSSTKEIVSAKSKGWYRIWDSGKKRFSLTI